MVKKNSRKHLVWIFVLLCFGGIGFAMMNSRSEEKKLENKDAGVVAGPTATPVETVAPSSSEMIETNPDKVAATTAMETPEIPAVREENPSTKKVVVHREKRARPETQEFTPNKKIAKAKRSEVVSAEVKAPAVEEPVPASAPAAVPEARREASSEKSVEAVPNPQDDSKMFWVWLGGGFNYTAISQDAPVNKQVKVSGIKIPSYMMKLGFWMSPQLGLDFGYKNTPGEVLGSDTFKINNGSFKWQTYSAEGVWRDNDLPLAQGDTRWLYRFGVQQHQMPFFIPVSSSEITVTDISVTSASLGVERHKKITKKGQLEILARYQLPLSNTASAGSTHKLTSRLNFDGSIGASYEITPATRFGIYWYGQYNAFDFQHTDLTTNQSFSGSQGLFYSTVDLRLGIEF